MVSIEKEVVNNNKPIFLDLKLKEAVDVLENHKTYTLQSQIKFPGKIENQTLILRFGLPCPLRIVDSTFVLNGKTPSKISISGDSTIAIELEYDAPFSQDQFWNSKLKWIVTYVKWIKTKHQLQILFRLAQINRF